MKKKAYLMPTMRSVGMHHKTQMLSISDPDAVNAKRNSYGTANKDIAPAHVDQETGLWKWE